MATSTQQTTTDTEYADEAETGDIIRIPQYEGALEVTTVSDVMLGVEFLDDSKKNSTRKSLMVNAHSNALYLVAGHTDKGRVGSVEVLA